MRRKIETGIMPCTVYQDMKINFNTAYCIAKEDLSFIKFKAMLDLQKKKITD